MTHQELADYIRSTRCMTGALEAHKQTYPYSIIIELIIPDGSIPIDSVHFENIRNWLFELPVD